MSKVKKRQRKWVKDVPQDILDEMIPEKVDISYKRPDFKDIIAEQIFAISKRSTCLFYNIGAIIFRGRQVLSMGYNGPSKGDAHCYKVGCRRKIGNKLLKRGEKGSGLCRGSHGEMNAIGNAAKNGVNIDGADMMVLYRPCWSCSKQIVNQGIKNVYYIFDYHGDMEVKKYLRRLGVKLIHYKSNYLKNYMKRNGYDSKK